MKTTFNKLNILRIKKDNIKKIPWILGSCAFLLILFFILLSLLLGVFLFYKYVILIETEEQKMVEKTIKFEYNIYQKVLGVWQTKEQDSKALSDKKYSNPFAVESENSLR